MVAYASSEGAAALRGIPPNIAGIDLRVTAVGVSPTKNCSRWLISAGPGIRRYRVFCSGAGWGSDFGFTQLLPDAQLASAATAIAFDADATIFVIGTCVGNVQRWQIEPPQLLWQTNFPNNSVSGINLLPDGRQIVTLTSNLMTFNEEQFWSGVRVWEIGATNFALTIQPDLPIFSTTLTPPDGKSFAYGRRDGIVVLAQMPLLIDEFRRSGNDLILRWQGGTGLYQLQRTSNLLGGAWENV